MMQNLIEKKQLYDKLKDYRWYAANHLKITTKEKSLVPFKFNAYQHKLYALIRELREKNLPVRIIVLKARQLGISTFCAGHIYHESATSYFTKSMIAAHDIDSTLNLFTMTKRMYDFSPAVIKPMSRYSNRRELVFENSDDKTRNDLPGLLSSIEIETANKTTAGRSGTIHHLHISELAFWSNAVLPLSGLLQAVPNTPGTTILVESTANGIVGDGETFYEMWKKAERGESDFTPFFIPWFENEEYQMEASKDFAPSGEEQELIARHGLTYNQLCWRQWKIKNDFNGDEVLFRQEFPSTPEEAFILSGRPVFNIQLLQRRLAQIDLRGTEQDCFTVYQPPEPGHVYAIGADVAEGLEQGDYSTAFVIDREYRQVASMKVHMDPDHFAKALVSLAQLYNDAILAPEINSVGYAVLMRIKDLGYNHVYTREEFDELADRRMKKLGWHTNIKTKDVMLNELKAHVRDDTIRIRDPELYKEMMTLVYEPDGSVILNGKDLTVSACIAIQALKQAPLENLYKATYPQHEPVIQIESFQERMRRLQKNKGQFHFD